MSCRLPWTALVLAAACLASAPLRADEAQDIETLYRAGDIEQAMHRADAAIAANARAAQIRFLKGVMLAELKREAEATQIFLALTEDFPELPDPYNNLAVLYAAGGQLQSALNALHSALRNDPAHRAARENLGDVHLAYAAAQATSKGDDAELRRKLRLAREIQAMPAGPAAPQPPG
jgi:Flp pilus assembly protein TadD